MASHNPADLYFGCYARFNTPDKSAGAVLAGPDNAVGDIGDIVWETDEEKKQRAWLKNPYGAKIGFLDSHASYKLALCHAKGWTIKYVLSFTAYSETPDPGVYWGQVAIIAYPPRYAEQFEPFLKVFAKAAADGLRPDPDLRASSIQQVLDDPQSWTPTNKVKIPSSGDKGTVILKDHRTAHDKILDKGRSKNIGCYIISWVFILAVVAGIVWLLHTFGLF